MKKIALGLIILCSFTFCKKTSEESQLVDTKPFLEYTGEKIIFSHYSELYKSSTSLYQKAKNFQESSTESNLLNWQEEWKSTIYLWKKCEGFDFGPVRDLSLKSQIHTWPTNTSELETKISEFSETTNVDHYGANKKGLGAIEYLLFDPNKTNAEIVNNLKGNRLTIAVKLCEIISTNTSTIEEEWKNGYTKIFSENTESSVSGSLNMFVNAMIFQLEETRRFKLGIPAGIVIEGEKHKESIESPHANYSLECIKANISIIKTIMEGDQDNTSLYHLMDEYNASKDNELLSSQIKTTISAIEKGLSSINTPLITAIDSQEDELSSLYKDMQQLVILLKVDLSSQMGILITYSDNDGD